MMTDHDSETFSLKKKLQELKKERVKSQQDAHLLENKINILQKEELRARVNSQNNEEHRQNFVKRKSKIKQFKQEVIKSKMEKMNATKNKLNMLKEIKLEKERISQEKIISFIHQNTEKKKKIFETKEIIHRIVKDTTQKEKEANMAKADKIKTDIKAIVVKKQEKIVDQKKKLKMELESKIKEEEEIKNNLLSKINKMESEEDKILKKLKSNEKKTIKGKGECVTIAIENSSLNVRTAANTNVKSPIKNSVVTPSKMMMNPNSSPKNSPKPKAKNHKRIGSSII
jgi:hypothetical protein